MLAARRGRGSGAMESAPTPPDEKIGPQDLASRPGRRTLLRVRCPDGFRPADYRCDGDGRSPTPTGGSPSASGSRRTRGYSLLECLGKTCALPVRTALFVAEAGRGRAYLPSAPRTSLLKGTLP